MLMPRKGLRGSIEKARAASAIAGMESTLTALHCLSMELHITRDPPIEAVWLATALPPASERPPL
jgi:hypothetical protein